MISSLFAAFAVVCVSGQQLVRFDYGQDIEQRSAERPRGCETVVRDHFTGIVMSSPRGSTLDAKAHQDLFQHGIRMAWICSTIDVRRPCGPLRMLTCDKRDCFRSLTEGSQRYCSFTDDDHIGFRVVEESVLDRFHRDIAERQLAAAETTRALVEHIHGSVDDLRYKTDDVLASTLDISSKTDDVLESVAGVMASTLDIRSKTDDVLELQDRLADSVSGVMASTLAVAADVDDLRSKTDDVLELQDRLNGIQMQLADTQDQMADRLAGIVEGIHRIAAVVQFVSGAIDRVEDRVAFLASIVSNFLSDVVATGFEAAEILYRGRSYESAAAVLSLAVYWLAFRRVRLGPSVPAWLVYLTVVRVVVKRSARAIIARLTTARPETADDILAMAIKTPIKDSKCGSHTLKGARCRLNRACKCGACKIHCKCA